MKASSPVAVVRIGDRDYEKPFDPACAACRSPWMAHIDLCLAGGWTHAAIRSSLAGRRPAPPPREVIAAHVAHLAPPHLMARRQLEHDAGQRGADQDGELPIPGLADVTKAAMQRLYERISTGDAQPSLRDVVAAMKFEHAREQEGSPHAGVQACQDALIEIYEIARRHLGPQLWPAFARDVYASEAITTVIGRPQPALVSGEAG